MTDRVGSTSHGITLCTLPDQAVERAPAALEFKGAAGAGARSHPRAHAAPFLAKQTAIRLDRPPICGGASESFSTHVPRRVDPTVYLALHRSAPVPQADAHGQGSCCHDGNWQPRSKVKTCRALCSDQSPLLTRVSISDVSLIS